MTSPLTPERAVYGLKTAGDPQVSPDGRRILYSLSVADRESQKSQSQLWLCDRDGGNHRRLTWAGNQNSGGRWSPDGTRIAFVSDRPGNQKYGIFVLPESGGESRELTQHRQSIGDLAWSPDGTSLAYTTVFDPENPDEADLSDGPPRVRVTRRIDYKQDNRGYLGDARTQIWVVDVAGGERRKVTSEPVDHLFPQWSPDGRTLAAKIPNRNGMCSQLALISVATGATTLIGPEMGVVSVWAWSAAGDRILFAGDTAQTWQTDFFLYDVATGETARLTEDLQCLPEAGFPTLSAPSQPVWLDDRRALVHAVRAGASGLYVIDVDTGGVEQIHDWRAANTGISVDAGKRYVVQGQSSLTAVGEIAVFDRETGQAGVVTQLSDPVFSDTPPAEWERFDVERGGFTIEAWLLKPPGFDPTGRYPLILDVHGGPNGYYGYSFNALQQVLATNGFLVVYANPRGSGSYGRHFTQQVTRDWGGEDYHDLMAVVDRVLERPYVDPERTGIYGYSYGGYMTAWTISQSQRFQAAVCGAPCFDLESMYGTSDISHTFGHLQWGGPPHLEKEWYSAHSPSNFAHQTRTPTLIMHGEADDRCPIGQGEQMFVALKQAGCDVEFVRYPGGSHLFLRSGPPAHREDFYERALGWFTEHLGGQTTET